MRIAFLDCFAGVAGDMWVGALLDLGLSLDPLRLAVASLGLPDVSVGAERVQRAGMAATRFVVSAPAAAERRLGEVRAVIARAAVPEVVRERAGAVFDALAEVEARAHGVAVERVHFHELGGEDTIVDVLCACLGLYELGIERVYASAVELGSGTVRCAHGVLPVPAPGALGNLFGVPVTRGARGERTTPTGAALLRVLCSGFEPRLRWTPDGVGCGAGSRDDPELPNVLRITTGRIDDDAGDPASIEIACNVDTADGETLAWLIEEALRRGAVDAWATPITMKKGRPGHALSALVSDATRDAVVAFLLEESSSLGVRLLRVTRDVLPRWQESVDTELGAVLHKCARLPSGRVVRRPEDSEVRRLCRELGLGRREVLARLGAR